jgi:hypothetical protein
VTAASGPTGFACYRGYATALLSSAGIAMTSYTGGRLSFDLLGDRVRAFRYAIGVRKDSDTDTIYEGFIFALRRRVVVYAVFKEQSVEPSVYDEHGVLAKAVARVR